MKFLLPRKIFYALTEGDLNVGSGWIAFEKRNTDDYFHVIISGKGFIDTLICLIKY